MFTKAKIALSIAIVIGTGSAALATHLSKHKDVRHWRDAAAAAQTMSPPRQPRHSSNPAFDVYDAASGYYVGSDPDPFIRGQLRRDTCSYRPCD
jgi:hypothetical protein